MTQVASERGPFQEGFRTAHRYTISRAVYEHFLQAFQDTNRLHTEDEFAQSRGFAERVMHGVILNGFVSHFVGVHFPGDAALLHSVHTQFKSPCHLGDEILIEGTVMHVAESVGAMTMDLVLTNVTRDRVAAKCKVQIGLP